MKLVHACLYARKDREIGFHHGGGSVKLVQACLLGRIEKAVLTTVLGAVNLAQACLSGRNHRESCFNHRR